MDDNQLLRRFVDTGDGDAFRSLVDRYLGLVIGATLRRSGDHSLAEEVAQDVFTALAQKAGSLKPPLNLAAWLHRAAHLQTSHRLRAEYKHKRKMDSLEQHLASNSAHADGESELAWCEAIPQLDEALESLSETDREIVLQRYFSDLSFRAIAKRIQKSEGATQRQGSRAIAKMSRFLKRRGVTLSAAALTAGLGAQLASPASAALGISVTATATVATTATTTTAAAAAAITTTSLLVMTTTKLTTLIAVPLLLLAIPVGIHILSSDEDEQDLGLAGSISKIEKPEPLTAIGRVTESKAEIDLGDVPSLLAEAKKITDLKKRALAYSELIRDLCLQGETEEAWALIDENPGIVREWCISSFFRNSGLELFAMIEKLDVLPFKEDLDQALKARAAGLSVQKIAEMVDDPNFLSFLESKKSIAPDLLDRFVTGSLGIRLYEVPDPILGPYSDLAANWHAGRLISDETYYYILQSDKYKDAFEKWDIIDVAGEENVQRLRQATVKQMMEADAEKAVSLILEVEGQQGIVDLVNGIHQWGELDAVAANRWFVENETQLSSQQRDSAIFAFVQLAIKHGETDGAEKWASLLKDPAARKAALKK